MSNVAVWGVNCLRIFSTGKPWNQVLKIWGLQSGKGKNEQRFPQQFSEHIPAQAALVFWLLSHPLAPSLLYAIGMLFMLTERKCAVQVGGKQVSACIHTYTSSSSCVHSFPDPSVVTNRQNLHLCFSFQGETSLASQSCPGWTAGQWRLKFCGLFEATGYKQKLRVASAVLQPECGCVLCHLNTAQRCGAQLLPS